MTDHLTPAIRKQGDALHVMLALIEDPTDRLLVLRRVIDIEHDNLKGVILPYGTKEQWSAVTNLKDAAMDVHSAAGWLARYAEKLVEHESKSS